MENFIACAIPGLLGYVLIRCLLYPMKGIFKAGIHVLSGFACLWILNWTSGYTGLVLPINLVTVVLAGIFGVPGLALIVLLELAA